MKNKRYKNYKGNQYLLLTLMVLVSVVLFGVAKYGELKEDTAKEEGLQQETIEEVNQEPDVTDEISFNQETIDESAKKENALLNKVGKAIDRIIENVSAKPGQGMVITCWGDSLTAGAKGDGVNYPDVIGELSGAEVHNYGVGGETSLGIAARQGGLPMQVNNITIPANDHVVIGNLADSGIYSVTGAMITPLLQGGDSSINPCTIAGVKGRLDWTGTSVTDEDGLYVFTRESEGEEVVIRAPQTIITSAMEDKTEDILVIFIGENGGWVDNQDLINQIMGMINYSACEGKFVVCGITSQSAGERATLESDMEAAFGNKYLNLRKYLVEEGLSDAGITPTEQDLAHMEAGSVPGSLRSDLVHGNSFYYQLIGEKIFEKITELGYFEN